MSNKRIHVVKVGDLAPDISITVNDQDGNFVILTGATITFSMWLRKTGAMKISAVAASLVDGAAGTCKYEWAGTDTDTAGEYEAEFRVTPASGDPFTVPTRGNITVVIK